MQGATVQLHPVAEPELLALRADMQARFLRIAELLESFGPQHLGMPHGRFIEGKLCEMRLQGRDGIARAIYAAQQGRTLLALYVFVKKTQTTRRAAFDTARKRLEALA